MKEFIIKRLLLMIPVIIGLSIIIFSLTRIMPGEAVRLSLGPGATEQQIEKMEKSMNLDKSIPVQYYLYMKGVFQGNLGESLKTKQNVMVDLIQRFPATIELTTVSMIIAVLLGVPLGVISAVKQNKIGDQFARVIALSGVAIPRFWLGIMLQIVFAYGFSILPIVGRGDIVPTAITGMYLVDSLITLNIPAFIDSLKHIILPAVALSLGSIAQIMRLTRTNMIAELDKDYAMSAKAYGLPKGLITNKYLLRNAFNSTLTIIGLTYGFLLGNAFLIEAVFGWPGMAQYGIQAVISKDINAVVGVTLVIGIVFSFFNLLVDILYGYIDPRIKYN